MQSFKKAIYLKWPVYRLYLLIAIIDRCYAPKIFLSSGVYGKLIARDCDMEYTNRHRSYII